VPGESPKLGILLATANDQALREVTFSSGEGTPNTMIADIHDRAKLALERIFPGSGQMATQARALDWAATTLGPPHAWPESLRVAYAIALGSTLPMCVFWGPTHVAIGNDAFVALLGRSARGTMALPARELWPGPWSALAPFAARVETSRSACAAEDVRWLAGAGAPKVERCATFSLAPLLGEDGEVAGIFCAATDTTERHARAREPAAEVIQRYESRLREMAIEQARAEQRERRRIATDLHDRIGQSLAVAQMKLAQVRAETSGDVRTALDGATRMLEDAIADTRTLIFEISPPILFDLGLGPALSWLAERLEQRHGVQIEIRTSDGFPPIEDNDMASLVFRIIQELLMNVVKHARVERAVVDLSHTETELRIEVRDLGVGFDAARVMANATGFGLFSAREQTLRVGGRFDVSCPPEGGTCVRITVPNPATSARRISAVPAPATDGGAT
jgi:signal transduction histidine kinase